MGANQRRVRIEWGDCDAAGIVYFPRYLAMFDGCTAAVFETAGLPIGQLIKTYAIVGLPVVDLKVRFMAPSSFGDEVLIKTTITEWGRSSFKVQHELFKQGSAQHRDELRAVEAREVRVWTGRDPSAPGRLRPQAIPREVIERFAG